MLSVEVLGCSKVGQILVITQNLNFVWGSKEVVPPCFKELYDGKELSVVDVIILFGFGKGMGDVTARFLVSIVILLVEDCSGSEF